jgi:hypothetical protein
LCSQYLFHKKMKNKGYERSTTLLLRINRYRKTPSLHEVVKKAYGLAESAAI